MTKIHIIKHNHIRRRKAKLRLIAVTTAATAIITSLSVVGAYTYADYKAERQANDYYTLRATIASVGSKEVIFSTKDGNMWAYAMDHTDYINREAEYQLLFNGNDTDSPVDDIIVTFLEMN